MSTDVKKVKEIYYSSQNGQSESEKSLTKENNTDSKIKEEKDSNKKEYISFEDFLKNITLDSTISSIGQLYKKYGEAEGVDLENMVFNTPEYEDTKTPGKNTETLREKLICFSVRIKLPNIFNESEERYLLFNYVNKDKAKNIEKTLNNNKTFYEQLPVIKNSKRVILDCTTSTKKEQDAEKAAQFSPDKRQNNQHSKVSQRKEDNDEIGIQIIEISDNETKGQHIESDFLKNIAKNINGSNGLIYGLYAMEGVKDDEKNNNYLTRLFIICSDYNKDYLSDNEDYLKVLARDISALVRNKHISNLMTLVKRETVKSAKAAIMSRNMSHNLGSHVMFYIKQKLQSVGKIFQDGALAELVNIEELKDLRADDLSAKISQIVDSLKSEKDKKDENSNLEMPFLVGLGHFLNYLQERQDYIATVATDYIPYKSAINFKDAIYDELKPELRFKRHHDNGKSKDISIVGKAAANLLLEYIAYSEGITQSNQIELLFRKEDTNNGNNTAYFDGGGSPTDVPIKLRQLNIALPGGNLGRQAFFSIMENIIRNTAKHDAATMSTGCKKLTFKYDLIDFNETSSLYAWTNSGIYKDSSSLTEIYKNRSNDFHYLGITIDLKNNKLDETLEKIKCGLDKGYLNDDGRINEDCKGIKEIRISAAWMRGYGIDTDIPTDEPPAVAIRNKEGKLQYIICLPKPKKVAIVGNKKTSLDENGIQFFLSERIKEAGKEKYEIIRNLADFEMIVCSREDEALIKSYVGSRILLVENVTEDTDISPEVSIDNLYMRWLHSNFGDNLPKLEINDGKSHDYKIANAAHNEIDKLYDKDLFDQELVVCHGGDCISNQIVYSKHYEGQQDLREKYREATFLEGVSGGNSTDRLIRQEKWTKEWYVKQMTAGLTKVAIFDERIHGSFVKRGKNLAYKDLDTKKMKGWLEEIKNSHADKFIGDEIEYGFLVDKIEERFNGIVKINDFIENAPDDAFTVPIPNDEVLKKVIGKLQDSVALDDYSTAALFSQKGIFAFDIYTSNGSIIIQGFSENVGKDINVATIEMENGSVKCTINEEFKNKYDFVTIHQGILDKIYETLGIKDNDDNKKQVTRELFCKFSKLSEESKTEEGFLPQFIIHSGRSRPTEKDMPQKQPFIQFAALDHAVRDCKYTLTELLYSAHYEQ